MNRNTIIGLAVADYQNLCTIMPLAANSDTGRAYALGIFVGTMYAYQRTAIDIGDFDLHGRLGRLADAASELFAPRLPHNQKEAA